MAIAIRSRVNTLMEPDRSDGFAVDTSPEDRLIAEMAGLSREEVARRRDEGHRPYVALLGGEPAGYGWVATRRASIGELDLEIELPVGEVYLWDFATLPAFRDRGVYSSLLAEIVHREAAQAERFWIIYAPENVPSARGIQRAGFVPAAELSRDGKGSAALRAVGDPKLAEAARDLLKLPVVPDKLAPCWRCGGCACELDEDGDGCSCRMDRGR